MATREQDQQAGGGVTDPRTLQANERTVLAWLRTGVSLITFGFATAQFGAFLSRGGATPGKGAAQIAGGLLVFMGAGAEILALIRFARVRAALLAGRPVPTGAAGVYTLVLVVALLGVVLGLYVVL
jgi:putative membrane protein